MSGGEQGFREGTGKWPEYYPDSLPAVVNIGIGSPTGTIFGTGAKFPAKYQRAFYALDWTYGRLIAAHLKPKGASYDAEWENFVAPKSLQGDGPKHPLNLTDAVIGDDGALYFTIGGRGTQAALYRVTYTGAEADARRWMAKTPRAKRRAPSRQQLENFHGVADAKAVSFAWPYPRRQGPVPSLRGADRDREPAASPSGKTARSRRRNPTAALTGSARAGAARRHGESAGRASAALGKIPARRN